MAPRLVLSALTDLITVVLLIGLIGLVNRLFRRPFFDRWRNSLFLVVSGMAGDQFFNLAPVGWRMPMAVSGVVFLLGLLLWLMQRPSACHRPPSTGANKGTG